MAFGAVAFVREDARRTAAAPDVQQAAVVSVIRLSLFENDSRSGLELERQSSRSVRPLAIALRI
jgi:hypothetical protein